MLDISDFIRYHTPFKNDALSFLSTESISEAKHIGYNPKAIVTWNYGFYNPYSRENISYAMHEIGHVIEVFDRKKHRLLQENYGYGMGADVTLNHTGAMVEVRTVAYQRKVEAAFPHIFMNMEPEKFHESLSSARNLQMPKDEFVELVNDTMDNCTLEELYNKFDAACEYIKANR